MFRKSLFVAFATVLLGGCTSTASTKLVSSPSPSLSVSSTSAAAEIDYEYIAIVNKQARMRGVGVVWVNLPLKRRHYHD